MIIADLQAVGETAKEVRQYTEVLGSRGATGRGIPPACPPWGATHLGFHNPPQPASCRPPAPAARPPPPRLAGEPADAAARSGRAR